MNGRSFVTNTGVGVIRVLTESPFVFVDLLFEVLSKAGPFLQLPFSISDRLIEHAQSPLPLPSREIILPVAVHSSLLGLYLLLDVVDLHAQGSDFAIDVMFRLDEVFPAALRALW